MYEILGDFVIGIDELVRLKEKGKLEQLPKARSRKASPVLNAIMTTPLTVKEISEQFGISPQSAYNRARRLERKNKAVAFSVHGKTVFLARQTAVNKGLV